MMSQEQPASEHIQVEIDAALRTKALETLLVEKGLITTDVIDEIVRLYERDIGPLNGAKVVAKAWQDPAYKQRLLENGTAAVAELGFSGKQVAELVVLENTPTVHNVVVCTLCSCYPWPVLGLPPTWYKSYAYRSRVVREPRAVLREFGLERPESLEIRVWDISAELLYMVLPSRPAATPAMSETELVPLVTRDAMIGVAVVEAPRAEPRSD